jgi:hypothetical protein
VYVPPRGGATVTVNGETYYYYKNAFYQGQVITGRNTYVVVDKPRSARYVTSLPSGYEIITVGNSSYFQYNETYYMPYLMAGGDEVYIVVDPPTEEVVSNVPHQEETARAYGESDTGSGYQKAYEEYDSGAETTAAAPAESVGSQPKGYISTMLTVPTETRFTVRIAAPLDSATNAVGYKFTGYLDRDLIVDDLLVTPKGSKVYGELVEIEKGGGPGGSDLLVLELTDIETREEIVPVYTYGTEVDSRKAKKLQKGGGGADLDAVISGSGTSTAAAKKSVRIPEQSLLEFYLQDPFKTKVYIYI